MAHGITALAETDVYFDAMKNSATTGGLVAAGYTEATDAIIFNGYITNDNTTHTGSAGGGIIMNVTKKNGTNVGAPADGQNLFVVKQDGTAEFVIDENGNYWFDGAAQTAFDTECDVGLVRTLSTSMSSAGVVHSKWDDYISLNECRLIDLGILGGPVTGIDGSERGLVNGAQLQRLHNGAIWQLHTRIADQGEEIKELQGQLKALQGGN